MKKKEITELKRRLKKEGCTITRLCGCYVNSSKEKVTEFAETFLNIEDEELHKYLDLAGKSLSGVLGNNLLELEFPEKEGLAPEDVLSGDVIPEGGAWELLQKLRESRLMDSDLVSDFYTEVINTYDFIGNYLILLFHDVYDVPMKGSDGFKLDDSEVVYDYILCAICPVNLSKPGLGYREEENRIGVRIRDWVVGPTDSGFLYPAFTDRSADIHHILVYTKNAKEPHKEFWENGLGCPSRFTATEKRTAFTGMITSTIGTDSDEAFETILDVQQNLNDYILSEEDNTDEDGNLFIDDSAVTTILQSAGISDQKTERIVEKFNEFFPKDERPTATDLIDTKAMKENEARAENKALKDRVVDLTERLEDAGLSPAGGENADIVVKVDPKKAKDITDTFLDGVHCLVIPIGDEDTTMVNGTLL